jgi:regulator of sirC expression with transglutaminase-like and TPR domain
VEPTDRFARLVARPEAEVRLDEAALVVAAHAYPDLDIDGERGRLDELASRAAAPTLDAVLDLLFIDERFRGDRSDYYDPRNSYLNEVLDRRLGIPITLSIVTLEVGRRLGVPLASVAMPGHFLLRDRVDPDLFVDPFASGARLDARQCEARFRTVHGAAARFDPAFLEPAGAFSVIGRLLANLKAIYSSRGDRAALTWVLRLRALVPGIPSSERRELATSLSRQGRFDEAALELDALADELEQPGDGDDRRHAARLRARLN